MSAIFNRNFLFLNFILKCRESGIAEIILKNNKTRGHIPHNFRSYSKAIVIKVVLERHKGRNEDQRDRMGSAERDVNTGGQLMLSKITKVTGAEPMPIHLHQ
jgi:hypothetical protein